MLILEAKELTKRFGGLVAVKDFNIALKEREIHGLIGPNGAGKTTVFNLIMGELRPDKGRVFYHEEDITNLPTYRRVQLGISRTYQLLREFPDFTLLENIAFPLLPRARKLGESIWEKAKKIAKELGIEEYLFRYPREVAIGILRKTELCRALITDPKIILCDELYSGLTYGEISDLNEKIMNLWEERGITFLIIDHNLKALSTIAKKVSVINFGEKLIEGTFEEVVNHPKVQEAYLGRK